ncbi:MAG: hypothetical protein NBV68_02655 [Erythrobacter sp.]|uniref:hypothetical protein n=1 Tax=Erythrobacter sp. TaxID=1042 RepID=UPI0025D84099|nr:hypothetical protein [Erythrobacter sp.]MCL9998258.1 hypothetical protein [Erythrobacter sp.]
MLTLVELFFDALSIGNEIERDRRDDRQRRRSWGKALTYTVWVIIAVVALVLFKLV